MAVPDASKTTLAWSFAAFGRSELWVALITFLYLDFLDATGTLFSMGEEPLLTWPYSCDLAVFLARSAAHAYCMK